MVLFGAAIKTILIIWVFHDLLTGRTWLHRQIDRQEEPLYYWIVFLIWLLMNAWLCIVVFK